jgi:hypothetical protein
MPTIEKRKTSQKTIKPKELKSGLAVEGGSCKGTCDAVLRFSDCRSIREGTGSRTPVPHYPQSPCPEQYPCRFEKFPTVPDFCDLCVLSIFSDFRFCARRIFTARVGKKAPLSLKL